MNTLVWLYDALVIRMTTLTPIPTPKVLKEFIRPNNLGAQPQGLLASSPRFGFQSYKEASSTFALSPGQSYELR